MSEITQLVERINTIERGLLQQLVDLELMLLPDLKGRSATKMRGLLKNAMDALKNTDATFNKTIDPEVGRLQSFAETPFAMDCEICKTTFSIADMNLCQACDRLMCLNCSESDFCLACSHARESCNGDLEIVNVIP
jgi:hypothetical protein